MILGFVFRSWLLSVRYVCTPQVGRGLFCWLLSVTVARLQGRSAALFGQRRNYPYLFVRGFMGAAAMIAYYFALLWLPLGDAVGAPSAHQTGRQAGIHACAHTCVDTCMCARMYTWRGKCL